MNESQSHLGCHGSNPEGIASSWTMQWGHASHKHHPGIGLCDLEHSDFWCGCQYITACLIIWVKFLDYRKAMGTSTWKCVFFVGFGAPTLAWFPPMKQHVWLNSINKFFPKMVLCRPRPQEYIDQYRFERTTLTLYVYTMDSWIYDTLQYIIWCFQKSILIDIVVMV